MDIIKTYKEYMKELTQYHFDNFYGTESDSKKHEEYWKDFYYDKGKKELKLYYNDLINRAGSLNSNQLGELNAIVNLLNEKYPDWRA